MARAHTKCTVCGDLIWFADSDPVPQAVQCICNSTRLEDKDGYPTGYKTGSWEDLTQEEIDSLTS